jgi:RNase P subunit RPR2
MSTIRKKTISQTCPHCHRKNTRAWVIRYESPGFVRLVYLCTHCEKVIRTEEEKPGLSAFLPSSSLITRLV